MRTRRLPWAAEVRLLEAILRSASSINELHGLAAAGNAPAEKAGAPARERRRARTMPQQPHSPSPLTVLRRLDGLRTSPIRDSREHNDLLVGNPQTQGRLLEMEQDFHSLPCVAEEISSVARIIQDAGLATRISEASGAAEVMAAVLERHYRVLLISCVWLCSTTPCPMATV